MSGGGYGGAMDLIVYLIALALSGLSWARSRASRSRVATP